MPEKVLKSPDLGFLEKRGDPVWARVRTHEKTLPLEPLNAILLWHVRGFKGALHWVPFLRLPTLFVWVHLYVWYQIYKYIFILKHVNTVVSMVNKIRHLNRHATARSDRECQRSGVHQRQHYQDAPQRYGPGQVSIVNRYKHYTHIHTHWPL